MHTTFPRRCFWILFITFAQASARAQTNTRPVTGDMVLTRVEGRVEVAPAGTENWVPAQQNQTLRGGDKLQTRELSRATLSSSYGDVAVRQSSAMTVPRPGGTRPIFESLRGFFHFLLRGQPAELDLGRSTSAAIRGTEFSVVATDTGRIEIAVVKGEVELTNLQGGIAIGSGQQGSAPPGQRPTKAPIVNAINIIQWFLYYPGVIDVRELSLTAAERRDLSESLAAYEDGDLVGALNAYPPGRVPGSDAEKVYRAALMLVVGEVAEATNTLKSLQQPSPLAAALNKLVSAVKHEESPASAPPVTATEWVAESYYQQSRSQLDLALRAARHATNVSPNFGFAWARVAELEFSMGRVAQALFAIDKALQFSPRHAEALALKGFLLSAQNKIPEALQYFDRAIATDASLANGWLGRGLCRIRRGEVVAGREDLRTAVAMEPNRAMLRSYLGKAFSDTGDDRHATNELALARTFDPNDPTGWLYSALHHQRQGRINDAIGDLERSQELNTNRSIYRSELLLDQDRAVRSVNLANIYYDAGMTDVSVREATRAVNRDYANYSAHLFLANSYDRIRDPKQINLRYETPTFSEYLVANLLAPVGAGTLSSTISQQEYSKLFERDRLGFSSSTEYFSRGDWAQSAAQYGTFGNSSYNAEVNYRSSDGGRRNNDFEQRTVSVQAKQQITPADTVYFQVIDYHATGGDLVQYYRKQFANTDFRFTEAEEPLLLAGYHHEWSPGQHTLFLASRLTDRLGATDPTMGALLVTRTTNGMLDSVQRNVALLNSRYHSEFEIYTAELQHIFQQPSHNTIVGARFQTGGFDTQDGQKSANMNTLTNVVPASQRFEEDLLRTGAYAYHHQRVRDAVWLIAGLSYDYLKYPRNFRFAPLAGGEISTDQISPKAGLIWELDRDTTFRAAYTRSLGGVSFDQSFRLEPSQVAGFNQAFRSLIPEALEGANAAEEFETYGVLLEHKFPTATYVALSAQLLNSEVERVRGTFTAIVNSKDASVSSIKQTLDFREATLALTANQLLGDEWALAGSYRVSRAELERRVPEFSGLSPALNGEPDQDLDATLHQIVLETIYNHPSGFFARADARWYAQSDGSGSGVGIVEGTQDFWQFNVFAGYRFAQRRAELTVGVLNLTDRGYHLNTLNLYNELPQKRTFMARFLFNF